MPEYRKKELAVRRPPSLPRLKLRIDMAEAAMEGYLLTPPEKGTIIGRAIWKPRYVVVGSPHRDKKAPPPNPSLSNIMSTSRIKDTLAQGSGSKARYTPPPDAVYLSLYKSKEEWEPIQQHSIASVTECEVQMIAHRKQGPVLPTLVIQISPDPQTDKLRKRRSSRTAGLTTTKESGPTTLWFRPGPEETYELQDWARYICSMIQPRVPDSFPLSPISPTSPSFINPFSPMSRDASDFSRPSSRNPENGPRSGPHQMHSSKPNSTRNRRPTYSSESASLRSHQSDVSSHAGSMAPGGLGFIPQGQQFSTGRPVEMPSPATTVNDGPGEYMLGWTSAQGRSSTLSSPVRGRESFGSQAISHFGADSGSPPGPRETILDRAFQLRVIPGSDRDVPGEEKLSSLARFDALMRDAESRRQQQIKQDSAVTSPMTSTWEEDDSDEEDTNDELEEEEEEGEEEEEAGAETDEDALDELAANKAKPSLSLPADRISASSQQSKRNSVNFYSGPKPLETAPSILRPHTAHSKTRPAPSVQSPRQQKASETHFVQPVPRTTREDSFGQPRGDRDPTPSAAKRISEQSKRLSSSSSLLLVQTNASVGSSRASSEFDAPQSLPKGSLQPRIHSRASHDREKRDKEQRRKWRNSVSVMGGDGGFL